MEENSSVKSLAERFQQKIFAQVPIDSLGLSPRGPVKRPQSVPEDEIRANTTRERKDSKESISVPNTPIKAIPKGMQLPRKNSEPTVKVADKETNPLNKRHKIVSELLETEQSYIKSLQFIFDKALTPLRDDNKTNKENPILKLDDILSIFSNWEVILKCHITLGDTIGSRLKEWDDNQKIGEIFLEETKFIKLYTYYVNNFDQARSVLTKCRESNNRFREFIENLERDEASRGLSFDSYLIMPVQRIPRYVLLLQDLLNNTVKEHPDYENIVGALGRVKDFANYINVSKRQTENLEKLRAIQDKLESDAEDIVKEGRKFVREGAAEVKDKKKSIKAQLYLLSDLLLITKPKKGKEVVLADLDLTACAVTDQSEDPPGFTIATPNGQWRVIFDDKKSSESWQSALHTQVKATIESLVGNSPKQEENIEELIADSEEQKQKNYLMRMKIMSELVEKEDEYVRTLKLIKNLITRLKSSAEDGNKVITLDVILNIFSSWEMLAKCHEDLLAVLKDRLTHWQDKPLIGDVFIDKNTGFFKLYRHYVTNRAEQMNALEEALAAAPLFVIAITEIEAMEKKKIEKILEEPCRRLSSYYFMLQELLRNTSRDHPDHQNLIAAVKYVQEMNKSNNEQDDYFPDSPSPTMSRPELKKKRSNSNFNGMLKRRNTHDKKDKK